MKINDVKEWLQIADEDLYSAKILNDSIRKPKEIIFVIIAHKLWRNI